MSARLLIPAVLWLGLAGCDNLPGFSKSPRAAARDAKAGFKPVASAPKADGDEAPAEKPAEPEKPKDPLDLAIEAQESYVYNPIGKRDPFRSFFAPDSAPSEDAPRIPTQRFDLDQFSLIGMVWGIDRPRALVVDPEGGSHILEIGTYIGKHWGKVTRITSEEVVVTEEYTTFDGELVVNDHRMALPDVGQDRGRL